jgi:hypothetical protein
LLSGARDTFSPWFDINESHLTYAVAGPFVAGWLWVLSVELDVSLDHGSREKGNEAISTTAVNPWIED